MFKFSFKQFINNLSVFVGLFLTLLLISILLATFSLILINAIYAARCIDNKLQNPAVPIAIFSSLSGLVFFLTFFALLSNINLVIIIQWKQFILLRILGCTDTKIKFLVFLENLIITILCIGLSLLIAVPMANLTISFMKSLGALESGFRIYFNFKYQWIYCLSNLFIVILITYFATLKIKKISIIDINNNFQIKTKRFALLNRLIFGLTALSGVIALVSIRAIMSDIKMSTGMIMCAIFCFIIAFGCLGRYFIIFFCYLIINLIPYFLIKNATKAILYNIRGFFFAVMLFISLILFINYSIIFAKNNSTDVINNAAFLLITIVISLFDGIILANSIFQYFWNRQKEFKTMRIIGYSKIKILFTFLIDNLVLNLIAFVFGLIPVIYFNYQYLYFNNINLLLINIKQFFLINSIIFFSTITIMTLPMLFTLSNKRLLY